MELPAKVFEFFLQLEDMLYGVSLSCDGNAGYQLQPG